MGGAAALHQEPAEVVFRGRFAQPEELVGDFPEQQVQGAQDCVEHQELEEEQWIRVSVVLVPAVKLQMPELSSGHSARMVASLALV